jgi:hypothetical protein
MSLMKKPTLFVRVRIAVLALLIASATVALSPAAEAYDTPCAGSTTGDTVDCNGNCKAYNRIGVYMDLDDNSESGWATGSCQNADAACSIENNLPQGEDNCEDVSEDTTSSSHPWTCHFEAHDVWWQPDNGFLYNCYSIQENPPPRDPKPSPVNGVGGGISTSPGSNLGGARPFGVDCARIDFAEHMRTPLMLELCSLLANEETASRVVMPDANVQMIVRAKAGAAAGIACDVELGCWIIDPVCHSTIRGFACTVTPLRVN